MLLLCLTYFAYGTISYSMGYFLPLIVKGWGVSNFAVGWIVAVPSVVGIFAMVIGAWFADRVEDKRPFLAALLVVCAIGRIRQRWAFTPRRPPGRWSPSRW